MSSIHLVSGIALACAALSSLAQGSSPAATERQRHADANEVGRPPEASQSSLGAEDRSFIAKAGRSSLAEIEAGQLAASRASDPALRDFGRRLARDHRQVNVELLRITRPLGVTPPTVASRDQRDRIQEMRDLSGEQFDRRFAELMIAAHRDAVATFRDEAQGSGRNPSLQSFARRTLPILQRHLGDVQALQARAPMPDTRVAGAAPAARGALPARDGGDTARELEDARQQVQEAVQVVQRLKSDPQATRLVQRAQGVFVLPSYGRAALGVGAQGGKGVLVTRRGEEFGNPAFYNMAGVSIGLQAGAAGGELVLLLMTQEAVRRFRSDRNFSLNADAGLTIGRYSSREQVSAGKLQDIVVWSGTRGAYAGGSIGATDVLADGDANRAYYGRDVTPQAILGGNVPNPHANVLGMVLGI